MYSSMLHYYTLPNNKFHSCFWHYESICSRRFAIVCVMAPFAKRNKKMSNSERRSSMTEVRKSKMKQGNLKLQDSIQVFHAGDFVWAKLRSFSWWPAIVISANDCGRSYSKSGHTWVYWFGDHLISEVPVKKLCEFISHFRKLSGGRSCKKFHAALYESLEILASRVQYQYKSNEDLIYWAKNGFKSVHLPLSNVSALPESVAKHLASLKAQKQNVADSVYDQEVKESAYLEKVKNGDLKIEEICIACYDLKEDLTPHPLFKGGLCASCKEDFKETIFAFGDDGKNVCCVICAEPGSLILCDKSSCNRSYCRDCIRLLLSPEAAVKILETSPWFCFFCCPEHKENGLLEIHSDWEQRIVSLFLPNKLYVDIPMEEYVKKRPLKVLSLFDGISTGKLALDSLGIGISKYYASEIDEEAIAISKLNHKDNIIHLGDVKNLCEEKLKCMCPIDLVIGGSPCNDLSLVNPARKGLYDFTGTGNLFFDFFHILKAVQRLNGRRQLFFLYENVASMRKRDRMIISEFLMCEPYLIDAKYFSAQCRPRYFWGNIPGMQSFTYFSYQKEEIVLNSFLLKPLGRTAMVDKIRTVTTQKNSLIQDQGSLMPVEMDGLPDILWVTELEIVFGFPVHYTDTGNLSNIKRRELIGRSWSVPVIRSIFQPLTKFFKCKSDNIH